MSLTKASYSMINGAPLSVADFIPAGTVTATTDCAPFFQAAITYLEANNIGSLYVPTGMGQIYMIRTTVIILRGDLTISGDGGNVHRSGNTGHITSDVVGLTLFNYGNDISNLDASFTVRGLCFKADSVVKGVSTQTCFKFSQADNGPHSPIIFRDCSLLGFFNAILAQPPADTLSPGFYDIQDCRIGFGTNAFNAVGRVQGLRYVANASTTGGNIIGKVIVWAEITHNLMESNTDCISINGVDGCIIDIHSNYYEDMTGDFMIKLGSYTAGPNVCMNLGAYYYSGSGGAPTIIGYYVNGLATVHLTNWDNTVNGGRKTILTLNGELIAHSTGIQHGYFNMTGDNASSTLYAIDFLAQYHSGTLTTAMGAVTMTTPHGIIATGKTSVTANTSMHTFTIPGGGSIGDAITVSALVRFKDQAPVTGWGNSLFEFFNDGLTVSLGSGICTMVLDYANNWYLMTATIRSSATWTTNTRITFTPYSGATVNGAGCDLAGMAGQVVASPSNPLFIRPMYPSI